MSQHAPADNVKWRVQLVIFEQVIQTESLPAAYRESVKNKQHSLAGAINPKLYVGIEKVRASLIRGADGLSARDVVEGAAFVYSKEKACPGCEDR